MAALIEYECPCCGGVVEFDSATQQMKCPYCDTVFDVAAMAHKDDAIDDAPADDLQWDTSGGQAWGEDESNGMRTYICRSCGGEILVDATTSATHCPYCDNPVVMTDSFRGGLKPDLVIPFKLDKEAAKRALKAHMTGKKLLPKLFKDENHLDDVKGIYVPFWLFDADAEASAVYDATRVRHWHDSRYDYTETQHFRVLRNGALGFDNIPVDGSSKMADDLMDSLEPFDFSEAVDFQTAYLSGYLADRYDVSADDSVERANVRVKHSTERALASTVTGYATVVPQQVNVQLQHGRCRYALLPVWLLNTTWQGKKYVFAMNGQTGKFVGNMPMDKGAYWKWHLFYTAVFGAAAYVVYTLLSGL